MISGRRNSFADYKPDGHNWITLMTGEYYPDILDDYANIEKSWTDQIIVLTLRMVPDRIKVEWLRS